MPAVKPPPDSSPRFDHSTMLRVPKQGTAAEEGWREERRRIATKAVVFILIGTLGLAGLRTWDEGMNATLQLFLREAITIAAAVPVFLLARVTIIDCEHGIAISILSLAAGLQMWDLSQEIVHYTLLVTVAWLAGMFVCLGILADLLDLEITEAAFVAIALLLLKLVLRWTAFKAMFE